MHPRDCCCWSWQSETEPSGTCKCNPNAMQMCSLRFITPFQLISYILYTSCFKVTCFIGNCIALQAVNVAWRTFGTTATASIHHPQGFQSAAAGAPAFQNLGPQNATNLPASPSISRHRLTSHGEGTRDGGRWFLPGPRKPSPKMVFVATCCNSEKETECHVLV